MDVEIECPTTGERWKLPLDAEGVRHGFAYVNGTVYCLSKECNGYEICDVLATTRLTDESLAWCRERHQPERYEQ